eukprot:3840372-Lingulodinium_polyedra.AAC.1
MTGFDASNAFMSVNHDDLMKKSYEGPQDGRPMKDRYQKAVAALRIGGGEEEVVLRPTCVSLQGDIPESNIFNDVYSKK